MVRWPSAHGRARRNRPAASGGDPLAQHPRRFTTRWFVSSQQARAVAPLEAGGIAGGAVRDSEAEIVARRSARARGCGAHSRIAAYAANANAKAMAISCLGRLARGPPRASAAADSLERSPVVRRAHRFRPSVLALLRRGLPARFRTLHFLSALQPVPA